jgi:phosphoserine phosphatase RsbU/P
MATSQTAMPPRPPASVRRRQKAENARKHVHDFWGRITDSLELEQLWGQFKAEAKESYGLYALEVDWLAIRKTQRWRRPFEIARALFWSMLTKLTPARRVILLVALVLLLVEADYTWSSARVELEQTSALLLFLLLALELADRVTLKRDLEIAREIQRWLVPREAPAIQGVDIAFATRPANTVSGDYYDAFLHPGTAGSVIKDHLLVVVADVAGKSVPAALLMATFQASLHALASRPAPLVELVPALNRNACEHSMAGSRFTTAFFAEIDPVTWKLTYINAGHNRPLLRHASGDIERLNLGGIPLGIFADSEYESGSTFLQPGDNLVIFTDGVVEAVDEEGDDYGEERLLEHNGTIGLGTAAETLGRLMASVDAFVGNARQHDDITCLVLRKT